MEVSAGGEEKPPREAWKKTPESGGEISNANNNGGSNGEKPKRKMKSPYQLEVLEQTYAVETYPSEALRAELSAKIGLSDRQLQMWFCHRRLKDRKFPPAKRARKEEEPLPPQPVGPSADIMMAGSGSPYLSSGEPRRGVGRAVSRVGPEMGIGKRYYEHSPMLAPPPMPPPQLSVGELRVIASVEAQLGEPLREDGPILGVEFDPLPPGAFGAPIAVTPHQQPPMRPYNGKMFERHEAKAIKTSTFLPTMDHCYVPGSSSGKRKASGGNAHVVHPQASSRALHEYQFLPEQPSIRSEAYERMPQSHYYDSAVVTPNTRVSSLPVGGQYLHGNEHVAPTYTFQGQLPQQGRPQAFSSGQLEYENAQQNHSFANSPSDAQFGVHQGLGSENPYLSSDRRIFHDDDPTRLERKRKSEEARIQKEVEAHEKRIRKELEKQDILRRKREEQMRKEMERHDRERRKEEERMLREKQREEERIQREQRRELERREKFLQKETRRAEKMRQKEELRREKEAARLKAANDRATARRIAREYMELIEDERLELMELAASSKGLSSIVALDGETLQQLDSFRDMLNAFPPKSVQLKHPFTTLPWARSDENVANFLMVWKFLVTFTDVLGLCTFTIDEFLQSLHDYDSKLLGEIHVALLKSIIKDIEDVARTPAMAYGYNQNSAANPGGGHPQIIEGAYAWGFDIRSWQRHLNFLSWPEILRQFAISAGFGPQLKKRRVELPYLHDDDEGNDGEDVISTLRNGAAAENAVALMHEKGYSHRRRSRHRLTPGTVKFAAFHVLSLEGSKGLTILEVAEKIQKSGLRDLTTSKTPEASIAAALSRDTKLFERTAPSTYCVRSPFRKDPADADAILSAAREKIQVFQNGISDSEGEKDADDADEAERDEDSECDGADDPEVDDTNTVENLSKDVHSSMQLKDSNTPAALENVKSEMLCDEVEATPRSSLMNMAKSSSAHPSGNFSLMCALDSPQPASTEPSCQAITADVEDTVIDESNIGALWVLHLMEGDYSDLPVEERLNALVALIDVAIEGNSMRVILEERLEAASVLKKQMWADAQLDKRRFKEEYMSRVQYSSILGSKADTSQMNVAEGSQTPPDIINSKDIDGNPVLDGNDQFLDPQCQNNVNNMSERSSIGQDFSTNPDALSVQQYGYVAEKSRSQLKSYIGHKAEQHYEYRSLPLGQDRRRNRYWVFSTSASPNEIGAGRIFVESKDGLWRLIDTEEAFDALLAALDTRGARESHLHSMMQRIEPAFKEAIRRNKKHASSVKLDGCVVKTETGALDMTSSPNCQKGISSPSSILSSLSSDSAESLAPFQIESGRNKMERNDILSRYKVFLRWMWKQYYSPSTLCAMKYGKSRCPELLQVCHLCYNCHFTEERHCPSCHRTFKPMYNVDAKFSEHVSHCEDKQKMDPDWIYEVSDSLPSIGLQLLKAQLSLMEASIPAEALQSFWTDGYRKSWGVKLHSSTSAEDLLQLMTLLENAIKRDFLSPKFETTNELLGSSTRGTVLASVPPSIAAVALRLLDLDASISYVMQQKLEFNKEKEAGDLIKLPSRFSAVKNMHELEPNGSPEQIDYQRDVRWLDPASGRTRGRGRGTRGRGGRGRGRGGRGVRGIGSSMRAEYKEDILGSYEKTTRKYTRRGGRTRGGWGRKRGRRSVRPRQRSDTRVTMAKETQMGSFTNVGINIKQNSFEESPRSSAGNEWGLEERTAYVEEEDNSSGSGSENGLVSGDEYDDQAPNYVVGYGQNKPMGLLDDETDEDEDDVDGYEVEDDRSRLRQAMMDVDVDDEDEEEIGDDIRGGDGEDVGGDVNGDEDDYSSSEYSD
ncbi:homeobox-DDT domain protein RLT2 isoform X2 [Asparagus officinalis]|uniref:homeobox-DDT domain protein RLT2 isoform X2 n=1 Tax=Asparagus officinalis TaxID=4686 RepID=UPI00098E2753|nr:homeobox-DDT domain protein RLT2 isoform X2 [Asparagus officinalis]